MSMNTFVKNLDKGFLNQAKTARTPRDEKIGLIPYTAWAAEQEGIEASPAQQKQWEDYWLTHCIIDERNPREIDRAEQVKSFAQDYAVLELLMKEAGIVSRGPLASTVEQCVG